ALELTEEHLGGLQHRQLVLEDQPSGQRLAGELRSRGWKVECNLTLTLRREADHWRPTDMVIEPSEEEVLELMRRWTGEDEALWPPWRSSSLTASRPRSRTSTRWPRHGDVDSAGRFSPGRSSWCGNGGTASPSSWPTTTTGPSCSTRSWASTRWGGPGSSTGS